MAYTQAQIRAQFLEEIGLYKSGTATDDGTTTTLIDTAAKYLGTYEVDKMFLYIATKGGSRKFTSFAPATGTYTVATAFSSSTATDDAYEILPIDHSEIQNILNGAILDAGFTEAVEDVTTTATANTYKYDVPAALLTSVVTIVEMQTTPTDCYIPVQCWRRVSDEIRLTTTLTAGKIIRIRGEKNFTALSADASSWDITDQELSFLVACAAVRYYSREMQRAQSDAYERVRDLLTYWRAVKEERRQFAEQMIESGRLLRR